LERFYPASVSGIIECISEDKIWPNHLNLSASGLAAECRIGNCS